jgi:hypothetical protein
MFEQENTTSGGRMEWSPNQEVCREEFQFRRIVRSGHGLRQDERNQLMPDLHDHVPCFDDFVGVGGPQRNGPRMARNDAHLLDGWWVGPSSLGWGRAGSALLRAAGRSMLFRPRAKLA